MNNLSGNDEKKDQTFVKQIWICGIAAGVSIVGYIIAAGWFYQIGFPLDDAWIHQTFARNLAQFREWAFIPGKPSAGSTSPAWTVLLSFGYLFQVEVPFVWTFFLGLLTLWAIGLLSQRLFATSDVPRFRSLPWLGLFLIFEWHLVWAASSGMETSLMAVMTLGVFGSLARGGKQLWIAAFLAGLSVWIRPDGLTLLGPVIVIAALGGKTVIKTIKSVWICGLIFLIPFGLYVIFNWIVGGNLWPNTFYAKQAEYAELLLQPFFLRFGNLAVLPLIGAGILLVPGFLFSAWQAIKARRWIHLVMFAWWVGYTGLYALRLPVVFQHGRYLIPAMPVFFILGLLGTFSILKNIPKPIKLNRMLGRVFYLSCPAVLIGFYFLGMQAYSRDVAIIETEMVKTAQWINENLPPSAVLAAHDIGAIGFYTKNDLVDLAGLVSPEVIPFIRDETKLEAHLNQSEVDYLITFPGWYPKLVTKGQQIFSSGGEISIKAGGENMVVYRWGENGP